MLLHSWLSVTFVDFGPNVFVSSTVYVAVRFFLLAFCIHACPWGKIEICSSSFFHKLDKRLVLGEEYFEEFIYTDRIYLVEEELS